MVKKNEAELLVKLTDSTSEILTEHFGLMIKAQDFYHKNSNDFEDLFLMCLIPINSKKYRGVLSLVFSKPALFEIVSGMTGEKVEEDDTEFGDAGTEILNMIYGRIRTALNEDGWGLSPEIPYQIRENDLAKKNPLDKGCVVIPFKLVSSGHRFHLALVKSAA